MQLIVYVFVNSVNKYVLDSFYDQNTFLKVREQLLKPSLTVHFYRKHTIV